MRRSYSFAAAVVIFIGLLSLHYVIQRNIDIRSSGLNKGSVDYILPPEYIEAISLGYRPLIADLMWLRVIQYMGSTGREYESPWLYNALMIVTTMDPRFREAYVDGGVWLSSIMDMGDEAQTLLTAGLTVFPRDWEMCFLMGFNYFFYYRDFAKASEYIARAASLPGSLSFLQDLAVRLYAKAGDPQVAVDFLSHLYQRAPDDETKEKLGQKLKQAIVERDLQGIETAVKKFTVRTGRTPRSLTELVQTGLMYSVPVEPYGGTYYISGDGKAMTTTPVERLKLYEIQRPERIEKKYPWLRKKR